MISGLPSVSLYKATSNEKLFKDQSMQLVSDTTYYYVWKANRKTPLGGTYVVKYFADTKDNSGFVGGESFIAGEKFALAKEIGEMRKILFTFQEMNQQLRIPMILSELEDIRQTLEDFKLGLVKVLPTKNIERVVKYEENIL